MKNMHLLIDTNIVLDWLQHREPDDDSSEKIMESCIFGDNIGYLSVHSLTNLFYIIRKDMDEYKRKKLIGFLHSHFNIISETSDMVKAVVERDEWKDIEDGLQMQCAIVENVDYIVTRNVKDFTDSDIPAILPQELCSSVLNLSHQG